MVSYWLPVVTPKTHADKIYWMPDVSEQVVCLMDELDEAGAVLGAIYSTPDPPPVASPDKFYLGFKDGSSIEYDRASHSLTISLCDGASVAVAAPGGITLRSGDSFVTIQTGGVTISPPLPTSSTVAQT
jgi:phage baseplate assembly protein V